MPIGSPSYRKLHLVHLMCKKWFRFPICIVEKKKGNKKNLKNNEIILYNLKNYVEMPDP